MDERVERVRASAFPRQPRIQISVQLVAITAHRDRLARMIGRELGLTRAEVLDSPYLWVGSNEELTAQIQEWTGRWRILHWTIPARWMQQAQPLRRRLASTEASCEAVSTEAHASA